MPKLHGMLWWIDRWRKSTAYTGMTLSEQGAYRNLLDEAWLRGGVLPDDDRMLARASGDPKRWAKVRPSVLAHFTKTPDGWKNETLFQILQITRSNAARQRAFRARKEGAKRALYAMDPDPDQEI